MKRTMFYALLIGLCLSVVGCGDDNEVCSQDEVECVSGCIEILNVERSRSTECSEASTDSTWDWFEAMTDTEIEAKCIDEICANCGSPASAVGS